jgi:alkanesulfonate monooxygenase SsuD/methylene tetrahydromethanopterin reductase-like flavin-dependent oxidoreductase (luciferase family)
MDPHATHGDLGGKRQRYASKLAEAGFSDKGRDIPMARLVALGPTMADAEAVARRGAQWLVDAYAGPQHRRAKTMHVERTYGGLDPVEFYLKEVVLHGTPDSLVDRIEQLKAEIGLNYLMCAPLSHETFMMLADKVVPRLV